MPSALVLLADGVEEIEFTAPVDLLRRAGIEVVTASINGGIHVSGRSGIVLHADTALEGLGGRTFDCLILPGGPGVKALRADPRVAALARAQVVAQKWLAAICAAPLVFHDAGLLAGHRFTAHHSTGAELPDRLAAERVVRDGLILTSRGAGTAIDFGLALIGLLASPAKAAEVAAAIDL